MTARTWEISDIDGTNKRTVTLAQYRAELDAAAALAKAAFAKSVQTLAKPLGQFNLNSGSSGVDYPNG